MMRSVGQYDRPPRSTPFRGSRACCSCSNWALPQPGINGRSELSLMWAWQWLYRFAFWYFGQLELVASPWPQGSYRSWPWAEAAARYRPTPHWRRDRFRGCTQRYTASVCSESPGAHLRASADGETRSVACYAQRRLRRRRLHSISGGSSCYMTFAGMSIVWARQLGHRPILEPMVFEGRIANPLLSQAGLGEFGLFSALSGVPILALAVLTSRRITLVPAILYALPGLIFLVRWWSETSPYNLDLLLSVFPGVFAACWMVASSRRNSMSALVIFAGLHALLWTMLGNGLFSRVSVGGAQ